MATLSRTVLMDEELEREASQILAAIGLSVDEAIRRLLAQVVHDRCLPFEMHTPNQETVEAMQELKHGEGLVYNSVDDLFRDIHNS